MVQHIIGWNYRDGLSETQKKETALKIKHELESLVGKMDGLLELNVHITLLPSSNRDIVLISLFESEEALAAYQIHPEHKKVSAFIGSVTQNRACFDYCE